MTALHDQFIGTFDSVDLAWRALVRSVQLHGVDVPGTIDPKSVGSDFGKYPRMFREIIGTSVVVGNPRDRLTKSRARPLNLGYLLANVIWTGAGQNDVDQIAYYNNRGREFSDNGITLEAAPGKRIFQSTNGNQFSACSTLLARDPSTRRAVISVYTPDDVGSTHRDCSCVLTLQFLMRGNQLHCVAGMRSQSAAMVFPYDAFLLTMLHESMAVEVGAELGTFTFHYGSLHFYHDEAQVASELLAEPVPGSLPMPPMRESVVEVAGALIKAEAQLRHGSGVSDCSNLDDYWRPYMAALQHAVMPDGAETTIGSLPSWYEHAIRK